MAAFGGDFSEAEGRLPLGKRGMPQLGSGDGGDEHACGRLSALCPRCQILPIATSTTVCDALNAANGECDRKPVSWPKSP